MAQHFLLSAAARTLSLKAILRMTDDQAHEAFQAIRWANNAGHPFCPRCGCVEVYTYAARRIWKCRDKDCAHQFSVTSGTVFSNRKLPIQDYLAAIAIFVSAVKGVSALQLGRDLDVSYKTAYVLAMKLRETMAADQTGGELKGVVEIDGCYFNNKKKPANRKADRAPRPIDAQVVVVARERHGRTMTFVVESEAAAVPLIRKHVATGAKVHADEYRGWDVLHASYEMHRINHSVAFSLDGASTNMAESFFSRLRRAEFGQHHRISGKYLNVYATEAAWREDHRRASNGEQWGTLAAVALRNRVSTWAGYWQRHQAV